MRRKPVTRKMVAYRYMGKVFFAAQAPVIDSAKTLLQYSHCAFFFATKAWAAILIVHILMIS